MKTENLDLASEWMQISDGIHITDMQVRGGSVLFALSVSKPDDNSGHHSLVQGDWVSFRPPVIAWVKSDLSGSWISASVYQENT